MEEKMGAGRYVRRLLLEFHEDDVFLGLHIAVEMRNC